MNELNDFQPIDQNSTQESLIPDLEKDTLRSPSSINIVLEFFVKTVNLSISCN